MSNGLDAVTQVEIKAGNGLFEAKGRIETFDGYRKLNRTEVQEKSDKKKQEEDDEKQILPNLEKGETLELNKLEKKDQKTKPPQRYTEASLIKKLEKEGIGRPSTYASIVATIEKRGYVKLIKRSYHAQDLGMRVNDYLVQKFPRVLDLNFTKTCEDRLDSISTGDLRHDVFLQKFWTYLRQQLNQQSYAIETPNLLQDIVCPKCKNNTKVEESPKWKGRYFYCCHSCKSYLECDESGQKILSKWKMKS
jgi:DNA topoisomerase-1